MSLMTRSPIIYNVHNKLQLLRPLRRGLTCLETSFSATFCEPGKPFLVTIRSPRYPQNRNCSYTIRPARPHQFCAPRSNLLPPHLTKWCLFAPQDYAFCPSWASCVNDLSIIKRMLGINYPPGENILFGRCVEFSMAFLAILPCAYHTTARCLHSD